MGLPVRGSSTADTPGLGLVVREWGRIGCLGFGGPPAHIRLLRDLCVVQHSWLEPEEFEDAVATCNLLPGPASTQLAILCAWRLRGTVGAILGGLSFILPGFVMIVALASLFLSTAPPRWVLAAGAGAGAAVAAVAVRAGLDLIPTSWSRSRAATDRGWMRWIGYGVLGLLAAATLGPFIVLVLLACGLAELLIRVRPETTRTHSVGAVALFAWAVGSVPGVWTALAWVAFKVGALSYGGGFVIVPLMQGDAVERYHWMTGPQFLNAVALGQITPGPVVLTIAVVGFAAAGVLGASFAAAVAFSPSFIFVLVGARHFDRLRSNRKASAFLGGAGPAAIGAILGSAVPLSRALSEPWQWAVLVSAGLLLLVLRRSTVLTLLSAALGGVVLVLLGAPLPA